MKFYTRLAYYLVGFVIGMYFFMSMWNSRGLSCNYFPNARVLNDIRQKQFYYSPSADSAFAQGWITKEDIKIILTHGDVDFDNSKKPVKGGKLYVIDGQTTKGQRVKISVVNGDDKALLQKIDKTSQK